MFTKNDKFSKESMGCSLPPWEDLAALHAMVLIEWREKYNAPTGRTVGESIEARRRFDQIDELSAFTGFLVAMGKKHVSFVSGEGW